MGVRLGGVRRGAQRKDQSADHHDPPQPRRKGLHPRRAQPHRRNTAQTPPNHHHRGQCLRRHDLRRSPRKTTPKNNQIEGLKRPYT
jgi:hypothetical protein